MKYLIVAALAACVLFVPRVRADESDARVALALAKAEESLRLAKSNAESLKALHAKVDALKGQCDRCCGGCPCGPDCPCPAGVCPDCPKPTATTSARGGHWNCGPGGCRFVPDRPTAAVTGDSPTPTRPKPGEPGDWQWRVGSQGVHTWVSQGPAPAPLPAAPPVATTPAYRATPVYHSIPSYRAAPASYSPPAYGGFGGYGDCVGGNCRSCQNCR
jgi:hypothetical protein